MFAVLTQEDIGDGGYTDHIVPFYIWREREKEQDGRQSINQHTN